MIRRDILSWWFRPAFLQPWGRPAKVLFAGPWTGEFGWEIMNWQAFLRKLSRKYAMVIVSCREGNQALYRDFADEFIFHDLKGTPECNMSRDLENPGERDRIRAQIPEGADWLPTVGWQPVTRKEFIRFGSTQSEVKTDILFHPRGRGFGADRNWDRQSWEDLLKLLHQRGFSLGCIGLRAATLEVEGEFTDYRDEPLDKVLDILASSRLVIGPSSGPMHLASICGTAHLVWTDRKRYARGRTNRHKYEKWWNPFLTQTRVLDEWGFEPSVKKVEENILDFMPEG
ncbi:glycosyltransferase family 9 protein [Fibrobacterota bacterium]